jgi:predicted RNA-binding protein associated with RNAse of E/G family
MLKLPVPREVTIVYRRLPNNIRQYAGVLREATASRLVIESPISVDTPRTVSGQIIADTGYLAIWFVYRNRWYDVAKFYDGAGRWIGYYCDIIKPVKNLLINPSRTVTFTDLFLDLWITKNGQEFILDQAELERALEKHTISRNLAREAVRHLRLLSLRTKLGRFPAQDVQRVKPLPTLDSGRTATPIRRFNS